MANNNTFFNGPVLAYSASSDKFRQGINLVNIGDFSNNNSLKIRNDGGFIRTLNGVVQRQNYFNEDFAAEHFGNISGSLATMDTQGQLGEVVDHVIERRDLGQTQVRDYGSSPFTDPDQLYDNPQVVLQKYTFNELTQDVLDVGPDLQRTRLQNSYYDLNENFADSSGNRYEAAANLRFWGRMYPEGAPADLSRRGLSPIYVGNPQFLQSSFGSKIYPALSCSFSENHSAEVTDTSGGLDFSTAPDGGPPTAGSDLPFSVSFWVKRTNTTNINTYISKQSSTLNVTSFHVFSRASGGAFDDEILFSLRDSNASTASVIRTTGEPLPPNEYHHVTVTYNGIVTGGTPVAGQKIYVDGSIATTVIDTSTATYVGMVPEYDQPFNIGDFYTNNFDLDGEIAEVAVWQKELSAEEVLAVYNATRDGFVRTKTLTSFAHDGIIEPLEIRRVLDRTLPGYPTVAHSVKSSVSISDEERRESTLKTDFVDLRDSATRPFLDQQGQIGDVDIPAQLSDADSNLAPFKETTDRETFYAITVLDTEIRNTLINGFVSGSVTYRASRPESIRCTEVYARHGTVFSQNDNYGYDSIAYGGLIKRPYTYECQRLRSELIFERFLGDGEGFDAEVGP